MGFGSVLEPCEIDPAEVGERIGRGVLGEMDLFLVLVEDLDVEAEALELLDEDLERLGHARWLDVLALDDRFVRLDASHDVVRLHGEQLLEDVGRAVGLEGPDLHLAEALTAELRLATQRLLRDEAVGAGRACVDLVLHQVVELEHVDVADSDLAIERLAGSAVMEDGLAVQWQARLLELLADLLLGRAVEHRRGRLDDGTVALALLVQRPAQVRLEDL